MIFKIISSAIRAERKAHLGLRFIQNSNIGLEKYFDDLKR